MTDPINGIASLIDSCAGLSCAIIGTGTSLEGFDFAELEKLDDGFVPTIGMNEAVKLCVPTYAVVCDPRAWRKAWMHYDPRTTLIMGRRCWKITQHESPMEPRTGRTALAMVQNHPRVHVATYTHEPDPLQIENQLFWHGAILTAALSLACALGCRKAYLYGVDFYRTADRAYAHNLSLKSPEDLIETERLGLYRTPSFDSMRNYVRQNLEKWEGLEVVNMSRYSQLGCFPVDRERGLPRV